MGRLSGNGTACIMQQGEFRIFLSAVTTEFGKARDAAAADLRSREALVRVQGDFRQEVETTPP
jgi:hypothetical protein